MARIPVPTDGGGPWRVIFTGDREIVVTTRRYGEFNWWAKVSEKGLPPFEVPGTSETDSVVLAAIQYRRDALSLHGELVEFLRAGEPSRNELLESFRRDAENLPANDNGLPLP